MIIKILYSVFVILFNYFIYQSILGNTKKKTLIIIVLFGVSIFIINLITKSVPNVLILFFWFFSGAIIVINYLAKMISVRQNSNLSNKREIEKIKQIMVNLILPIFLTIYQFLMIWSEKILEKMMNE